MRPLASRIAALSGEGALAVFTRARQLERAGRSVIHLELGEPDFHPAPPVLAAARRALDSGRDRYCPSAGIPELRQAVAEYLRCTRGVDAAPEQVLVAPGCKILLFMALLSLVEPGDGVLYPDPGFPAYASLTRGLGGVPQPFLLEESLGFQPDLAALEAQITPRTRVLMLNFPGNPTGSVAGPACLEGLARLAVAHDLFVVSDEIYARIVYGGQYRSIASLPGMAERTVIVDGFSKSFAMTGWRLGYAVAPPELHRALDMLVMNSYTCVNEFVQCAAVEALRDSTGAVEAMVAEFARRRDLFVDALNRIPGFRCLAPEGAFYAWVNVAGTGLAESAVAEILLEEAGVAAVPGPAFGPGGAGFLRFSFASSVGQLEDAASRIAAVSSRWAPAPAGAAPGASRR
ncbi:MAG TPA: pyridoxal phosphate-dependent aminotransferase [Candidatus Acidoferrales bacterium]|nr:pyridoxal phosphate-dependent aminotransferase [Candidatus Acidoferrales bacterium]